MPRTSWRGAGYCRSRTDHSDEWMNDGLLHRVEMAGCFVLGFEDFARELCGWEEARSPVFPRHVMVLCTRAKVSDTPTGCTSVARMHFSCSDEWMSDECESV